MINYKENKSFASDNNSGVHPEILKALSRVNSGHMVSYGDDPVTKETEELFKSFFGRDIRVYFLGTGTAANVIGIQTFINSFNSVLCSDTSHLNVDECGSLEKLTGAKTEVVKSCYGKINIDSLRRFLSFKNDPHHSQPRVISISQPTELGTVYSVKELNELADFAHENGLLFHVDGARLANAVVALGLDLSQFTRSVEIDFLSFGGTKNGLLMAESIVIFDNEYTRRYDFKNLEYYRKQGMQLVSKMRYISAQFYVYLKSGIWSINAVKANKMSSLLRDEIQNLKKVRLFCPVQTNAVFAYLPKHIIRDLQEAYFFYVWQDESDLSGHSVVRFMTSFDTEAEDIGLFVQTLGKMLDK